MSEIEIGEKKTLKTPLSFLGVVMAGDATGFLVVVVVFVVGVLSVVVEVSWSEDPELVVVVKLPPLDELDDEDEVVHELLYVLLP